MSEGSPSIIDIVAPGKTGLSEEEWGKAFVLLAKIIRREAESTTVVRLSGFLNIRVSQKQLEKIQAPTDFYLAKQGIYFSTEPLRSSLALTWYTWGVCREDGLLFLGRAIYYNPPGEAFVLEILKPTPANILKAVRECDGDVEYLALCRKLAGATGEFVNRKQRAFLSSAASQAQAEMIVRELERIT